MNISLSRDSNPNPLHMSICDMILLRKQLVQRFDGSMVRWFKFNGSMVLMANGSMANGSILQCPKGQCGRTNRKKKKIDEVR